MLKPSIFTFDIAGLLLQSALPPPPPPPLELYNCVLPA